MHTMTRRGTQAHHAAAVVALVALLAGCSGSSTPEATRTPSTAAATAPATATTGQQPALAYVHLPAGYRATLWASGLNTPRFMTFGPDGALFVAERGGSIVALRDPGRSGRA